MVFLPACLESVMDIVDEAVIADTGSTDQTKAIAARYGAKVMDFPWVDSFAAARNASLAQVTGDWVLWLDADDRLDEENRQKLRRLLAGLRREMAGYAMKCLCLPDPETGTATCVDHLRLFAKHPDVSWEFRVHEQVLPSLKRQQARIYFADIAIQHTGYLDAATRARKRERDLRLLQLAYQDEPAHPFTLFNLGCLYQEMNQPAQALEYCRRSLEGSEPEHSIVRKLYSMMAACQRQLGQPAEAVATCQAGRRYYAEDVELLFQEGLARRDAKDPKGAIACFRQALVSRDGVHFGSVVVGLQGFKTRHNLGVILAEQGRLAEAEAEYRAALAEHPGYVAAWAGLGDLYIRQGRWLAVERVAEALEHHRGTVEAVLVLARAAMARQDYGAARRVLEAALAGKPAEERWWICLSHTLLQEGKDWTAAESALRRIVELNPNNVEARQNLAQLQRQLGRESGAGMGHR